MLYADQWNAVQSEIGAVANGKTIDRILLAYDDPQATASTRFQGWLDDVTVTAAPAPIDGSSLTNYVDTRRGTNASGSFSRGNNLPISALPNGFNFFTPVTNATSNSWEYDYQQGNNADNLPTLQGLAISHEPSPWMGDRNQMSVMPVPAGGSLTGAPSSRALAFSHDDEIARPDFYQVTLQNGLIAQMSPTDHGGIMQFTFPSGQATGSLVFYNGTFTIGTDGTFTGWVDNGSGLSAGRSRMFVSGTFDRAPTASSATSATFDTLREPAGDAAHRDVVHLGSTRHTGTSTWRSPARASTRSTPPPPRHGTTGSAGSRCRARPRRSWSRCTRTCTG